MGAFLSIFRVYQGTWGSTNIRPLTDASPQYQSWDLSAQVTLDRERDLVVFDQATPSVALRRRETPFRSCRNGRVYKLSNSIAAATPPAPCGTLFTTNAISTAASVPRIIGSFRSPR